MSIWQARPVVDAPEITLRAWRVMETDTGGRHFVGVRPDRGTGRVSSAIVECDMPTRTGVTRSGRRYVLEGPPEPDSRGDSEYVWVAWCQANRVADFRDITNEVFLAEP
jgi:hypothetical protein